MVFKKKVPFNDLICGSLLYTCHQANHFQALSNMFCDWENCYPGKVNRGKGLTLKLAKDSAKEQ